MPKYKEKRIHEIIIDDNIVGHIFGINLKPLNYNDEKHLEEYMEKIKMVMEDNYKCIYIEENLPFNIKKLIKTSLSMGESNGMDIKIYNIPYIIEELVAKFKGDITREEVLIISNNRSQSLGVIDYLSNKFSFVSLLGLNEVDGESLYEEVLESTGISVYLPHYDNISLRRYGLIINTLDNIPINFTEIRKKAIIVDFSEKRPFLNVNRYVMEDVSINLAGLGLADNHWIPNEIDSELYNSLFKNEYTKYCRIYKEDSLLTIEDFANQDFKIKGGY